MKKDEYNLVVFGSNWDVYKYALRDWIENPKIHYILKPKGLLGFLQRIHFSPKLNERIKLPLKDWWTQYFLYSINYENPCFLILEDWLRLEPDIQLLNHIKIHYPKAPIICFVQDLLHTIKNQFTCKPIDVDHIKKYCDLFISYDKKDAKKYNIDYHSSVYSKLNINEFDKFSDSSECQYDLYFMGRDKGRLNILMEICNDAKKQGLRCKFLLIEVPYHKRVPCEGIEYLNHTISYPENLRYCANSRCILELLQQGANSPTYRTWEAIAMEKRLITNNKSIMKSSVYDPSYILCIDENLSINLDFVFTTPTIKSNNITKYQDLISPNSLLKFIENKLNIHIIR